jgi:hypothetical protein
MQACPVLVEGIIFKLEGNAGLCIINVKHKFLGAQKNECLLSLPLFFVMFRNISNW